MALYIREREKDTRKNWLMIKQKEAMKPGNPAWNLLEGFDGKEF